MIQLSYIIPMYNAEPYIGACLDSIAAQGLPEEIYEIIVIDDGSTDNSAAVVKRYPHVRYVYQTNQGQSAARNKGIAMATGEYICFVDSDDTLVPRTYPQILQFARSQQLDVATFRICNTPPIIIH